MAGARPPSASFRARISTWAVPALLLVTTAWLFSWTARSATDALVDAGRELYLAWRISEGDRLYGDLRYEYGPLSAHWNALLFWLWGPGLRTLLIWNAVWVACIAFLIHRVLRPLGGPLAAATGAMAFLLLFAFGQYDAVPIFAYLSPYTHTITHGVGIGFLSLALLDAYRRRPGARLAAAAGVLVGLAFLTKPEVFLATAGAVGVGLAGLWWLDAPRGWPRHAAASLVGFVLPPLLAFGGLAARLPVEEAWAGTLGAFVPLLDPVHMQTHFASFSRRVLGLDAPGAHLGLAFAATLAWAIVLGPAALLAARLPDTKRRRRVLGPVAFCGVAALVASASSEWTTEQWAPWSAPLPWLCLGIAAWQLLRMRRARRESDVDDGHLALATLCLVVLALGFLTRTGLRPRISDYGFVAAMPAAMVAVLAGVAWAPRALERRGRAGWVLRGAVLGLLAAMTFAHLQLTSANVAGRRLPLGDGVDAMRVDARGPVLNRALHLVEQHLAPGEPLLVLPQGVMLNYLSRRPSATPHLSFIPPMVAWFGEAEILADLEAEPPRHILMVDRETAEFGPRFFGRDYAQALGAWVQENYRPVARSGGEPLQGEAFGAVLLERRP